MGKVLILLLTSLIVMPMCIGIVSADSVPCTAGSLLDPRWTTCYSNKSEAVLAVPSYITPKDCFVWEDAWWPWSLTHPWTVIPGDGCAHWVAHQLNIKHGEGCYVDYSIRIDDIISGRTEITDLRCCKADDIWIGAGHSGIVRQVDYENKEVEVESCSSVHNGVGKSDYNFGTCWRDGSCEGTSCGDNAHCSADCKCVCDAGYGNCDEDWSNGCEVNLKTDSKNCGSCGNDCDVKDGWYCNEANDHNYYFDYYCADSKCDSYHITQSKNCNDYDGWHCAGNGQKRQKWDGYCQQDSLLICDYDVLVEQDCDTQGGEEGRGDGCYAYGNGCEDRDYFCSDGSCAYTYSNRHTDYYDDWIYYCKGGDEVWKHRLLHDFYCEGGTCTNHTSWEDDQLVEDCNQYEGWVCDGNIRTYCNGVCIEGGCACEYPPPESEDCDDKDGWYPDGADAEEYRDYRCSDGECVYDVTDHRCNAGFGNCDGDWSNDCEVNLNIDSNNCGSCGNACDPGVTCEKGECCGEWEDGCCKVPSGCISGYLYVAGCKDIGGSFYKGQKCCDGNCHECCTDDHCQKGYICNPETHKCEEEVPEFPAGVTAVFGATLFIFLMMRRKYVRK